MSRVGRAGPPNQNEKSSFKNLFSAHKSDRDQAVLRDDDDDEGLVFHQESWLTLQPSSRPLRLLQGTNCKHPVRRKSLRKKASKAPTECDAGRAALPGGKVIHRLVVTKLWVNGRASEDGDEWTEEVRAHCERCNDDKAETSEVQAERIRRQRVSGDRRVALHGRRVQIAVDRILRARGKLMRNEANGPADCLVKMLQCLPTEAENEVAYWFDKRLKGECRAPEAWKILRFVFLKKPDAKLEKGLRDFRPIALLSVFL